MQKNILVSVFLAVAMWLFLPSCDSDTNNNGALQVPEAKQTETPAGANNTERYNADESEGAAKASNMKGTENAATANIKNLLTAYAGETTASAKYAAYSKKAQEEGWTQIALLFKATSISENIHANNHRAVLEEMGETIPAIKPQYAVNTTRENLADAISGESYEITTMYPDFIATANTAENEIAVTSLKYAYRTEQKHKLLYEKALAALQTNQVDTLSSEYVVCPTCGNTYDSNPPKRCRISMTKGERFIKV
ncbi:MAG: rubrerythrin family protein [Saprospiraceae bacterium]|nr:rubrerythrin family protein [Saprospiraceae bacterium]MDZ4703520.1 rubrerythrin family protein [Saprospiraceae bacterium]